MTESHARVNRVCGNPICGGACWDNDAGCWHEIKVGDAVEFEYGTGTMKEIGNGYVAVAQGSQLWFRRPEDVRKVAAR